MTFGKRQLVIGALVAALGAAVYLNWQFSGAQPVAVSESSESSVSAKQLGQTTYVNTEISGVEASANELSSSESPDSDVEGSIADNADSSSEGEVKETAAEVEISLTEEQSEFFETERAKRDEIEKRTMSDLTEIVKASDSTENAKVEAIKAADLLAETIKMQGDIETEIKTKGFADCLVSVNNSSCTVIVPKDGLNEATVVTIKDIVNRHSSIDFDQTTITSI